MNKNMTGQLRALYIAVDIQRFYCKNRIIWTSNNLKPRETTNKNMAGNALWEINAFLQFFTLNFEIATTHCITGFVIFN